MITIAARISEDMTYEEITEVIYRKFEVGQSCSIRGMYGDIPLGQVVINRIRDIDLIENTDLRTNGQRRRKIKIPPNSVGGYVAHKIFKWAVVYNEGIPKYTIWRYQ